MTKLIILIVVFSYFLIKHETSVFPTHLKDTAIAKLKEGDSLFLYQCQIFPIKEQQVTTNSGQQITLKSKKKFISFTEKIKIYFNNNVYQLKHYTSSLSDYPNKKYAYLKLVEKSYWEFKLDKDTILPFSDVLLIAAYEKKCLPVTEYDFKVVENNSPQMIINGKKIAEQYRLKDRLILSEVLSVLKNK